MYQEFIPKEQSVPVGTGPGPCSPVLHCFGNNPSPQGRDTAEKVAEEGLKEQSVPVGTGPGNPDGQ